MNKTIFKKDPANRTMFVSREFAGNVDEIWKAWTDRAILDQWWAPKPWKASTRSMDFREGGVWLYCMEGPAGERHWAKATYTKIRKPEFFEMTDAFCDENGNESPDQPKMKWRASFKPSGAGTVVEILITFPSAADMEKIAEMGFQEGFAAAHDNLDELLSKKAAREWGN